MSLTSASEYKTYAGISGSTYDSRLATLVSAAEAFVARYCGRTFESATYTHTFDGSGNDTLQLRAWPVTSITSVTEIYIDGTTEAYDSDTYRFDSASGVLSRVFTGKGRWLGVPASEFTRWGSTEYQRFGSGYVFPQGYQNIRVVYVGGYATIPDDLKLLVWKIVDVWFKGSGQDHSMQSESIGDYSYTKGSEPWPMDIQIMLDGWKVGVA